MLYHKYILIYILYIIKLYKYILEERTARESQLKDYFVERLKFFDTLRKHLKDFPSRLPRADSAILPNTSRVRENRDIERVSFYFLVNLIIHFFYLV